MKTRTVRREEVKLLVRREGDRLLAILLADEAARTGEVVMLHCWPVKDVKEGEKRRDDWFQGRTWRNGATRVELAPEGE